jgi:GMP synthase (glutamine-hydrolysing)
LGQTSESDVMRVLVVENFRINELGQVGIALAEAQAEIVVCKAWAGDRLPDDLADFDGMVVLGGEQNALADDEHPYLPKLARLMRDSAVDGKAVLGICLGSQVLARGCDAENMIGTAPEFGWQTIELTEAGKIDPVLGTVPSGFPIFEWHSDTFTLPANAIHLATNGNVANQAFRIGRAGYGMQFHFEANRGVVENWNREFESHLRANHMDFLESYPERAATIGPVADDIGLTIARAWVSLIEPASIQ